MSVPLPAPGPTESDPMRAGQLAGNLAQVRDRIAHACAAAGRAEDSVTLVAITKTWPAADVRTLAGLGVRHVGENRDQEARPKAAQCADLDLTWHFVGQLQRNKAASVAHYAHIVESVDRLPLVEALDRAAERVGRRLGACVQVDLAPRPEGRDGSPGHRGGATASEVLALADAVAGAAQLDLLGVMAVAPLGVDPRIPFERLAQVHDLVLAAHPGATMRSAGMSADLEAAIAAGATHVRLGSALLGHRPPLK
jgi:pyridoxal phosphate enzyme (YggS family)